MAGRSGMTFVEKVTARTSGRKSVRAKKILFPIPDLVVNSDGMFPGFIDEMLDIGATAVVNADRNTAVADHDSPRMSTQAAGRTARNRILCAEYGVRWFHFGRSGNSHIFPVEQAWRGPGMLCSRATRTAATWARSAQSPCAFCTICRRSSPRARCG